MATARFPGNVEYQRFPHFSGELSASPTESDSRPKEVTCIWPSSRKLVRFVFQDLAPVKRLQTLILVGPISSDSAFVEKPRFGILGV